ncbi:sigma-70 family RNA polymerase sigma factor [Pedobacter hiemivivus]|uniref:Sigma-70 family RNA polymerase sigma factor n=1 Tax=Pedobacter hiemivivus TaxID=2530454 RepID=A0A4R0MWB0_9SPHI|nr:sigma-70 family RNA polymerase sigma factor [Pedobacter hiemivivus]TCC91117.1 sigma-70 family RNA polymerase sigma factor [Pedobacter hiemivivus]TKC63516.1 sigma-70 family RNA polymerase sigma factor [Pedobacter hiemivivus]
MSNKISSSVPTDREVVLGILNNSEEALNKLYAGYFPMILQFILNNNGDEDDAKDVYQEGIIVLYNKIKSGNFELSSKLKTYIYSVCRRIWLKKLSQQSKKSNDVTDFDDLISVEEDVEQHEEKDRQFDKMQSALLHLGEPCKTIIQDFYINNLSMQDICEKFGYTNTDNAKTQKYKCLQRLKKLFFQS